MVEWFEINAMQANPDKFQGMLLKGAKTVRDFTITVEGTKIAFASEINALGVCIDDQLSFNAIDERICAKASRQVNALQRLTGVLDYESRLAIYKSFIMSNFDYCPIEQGLLLYWLLACGLPPSDPVLEGVLHSFPTEHFADQVHASLQHAALEQGDGSAEQHLEDTAKAMAPNGTALWLPPYHCQIQMSPPIPSAVASPSKFHLWMVFSARSHTF